jgi:hypothetical protein
MNTSAMPMPRATEYSPEVDNEEDDISDIVSEGGDATQDADDDIKEVKLPAGKSKRGRKKKVEINL